MKKIKINPKWQLHDPAEFDVSPEGTVEFRDPLGAVFLPDDYLEFMKMSDGAVLRYRDAWFIGHFSEGMKIIEIDYLSKMNSVIASTDFINGYVPESFIHIGGCELEEMEVLLCTDKTSGDFGKVYVWKTCLEPWMEGSNTLGLGFVADSFTDFMNNLAAEGAL